MLKQCGYTSTPVDAGSGPAGDWTAVPTPQDSPGNCAVQCAMLSGGQRPFVAVLPQGKAQVRCWCAGEADLETYGKVIPEEKGRAQIYDCREVIRNMMS